jgi:hypothetical protein
MKTATKRTPATVETDPFDGAHRPDWDAHGEDVFVCSAGESGRTRDLRAVLCVQAPGVLARLDGLEADSDVWTIRDGVLIAGFPPGGRRSGRTGAWMRAEEHDGVLRVSFVPRGRPVVRFVGDGFVGTLADNDATFRGARHWWSRTAQLLDRDVVPGDATCAHPASPVPLDRGIGVIGTVLTISALLGGLLYLLR